MWPQRLGKESPFFQNNFVIFRIKLIDEIFEKNLLCKVKSKNMCCQIDFQKRKKNDFEIFF